ncbi:hypothetical protein CHELA1G2_12612 [Hyphomicrobiales bacterium]|nr:hypothetical protein CHELA1G2_12612 [Hyphomicrobiales bacterium]
MIRISVSPIFRALPLRVTALAACRESPLRLASQSCDERTVRPPVVTAGFADVDVVDLAGSAAERGPAETPGKASGPTQGAARAGRLVRHEVKAMTARRETMTRTPKQHAESLDHRNKKCMRFRMNATLIQ